MALKIEGGARLYINNEKVFDNWDDPYQTTQKLNYRFVRGQSYDLVLEYNSLGHYSYCSLGWDIIPDNKKDVKMAEKAAKNADVAIIVAGVTEKEGQDRASLDLPESIEEIINVVGTTGTPTVVVFTAGSAITMTDWFKNADAILEAWYPGQEGGTAVAEALFGQYNPGGKLPITFPLSVAQCPIYYNYKPSGRGYGYVNMSGEPMYEFGYGLSYTDFEYRDLKLSSSEINSDDSVKVSLQVKNIGKYKGDEVVQLYIHDKVASVTRPVKELKAFKRISLDTGETKKVIFDLTPESFKMWDRNLNYVVEPGEFDLMVGSSSKDIRVKDILRIQ